MATRARRRLVIEPLENRMVLSRPHSLTLAVLGDSYSAEYATHPTGFGGARNWVELLSATHRASFGPAGPQASSSSPNPNFPYDWAAMGATSTNALQTQLPGLLPEVSSGSVSHVCIFIGINDFGGDVMSFVLDPQSSQADLAEQVDQTLATATSNLDQIVMRLLQANPQVKLVVGTIPDVTRLPFIAVALNRPGGQALGADLSAAVQSYNDHIRLLATIYPSVALADVASSFQAHLSPASSGTLSVYSAPSGSDLTNVFQIDGLHPNTVPQGWIANDFLSALHSSFGVRVPTISPMQVNQLARVSVWRQSHGMPLP